MNGINPPIFIRFKKPLSKLSQFLKDQIYMKKDSKIYIAGHNGMVGSAIQRLSKV